MNERLGTQKNTFTPGRVPAPRPARLVPRLAPPSRALPISPRGYLCPSLKNCLSVATWFRTLCFPSPVLLEVKIIGGISSQYSLTSRQNASTFSSGLALFPAFILRFLSTS